MAGFEIGADSCRRDEKPGSHQHRQGLASKFACALGTAGLSLIGIESGVISEFVAVVILVPL